MVARSNLKNSPDWLRILHLHTKRIQYALDQDTSAKSLRLLFWLILIWTATHFDVYNVRYLCYSGCVNWETLYFTWTRALNGPRQFAGYAGDSTHSTVKADKPGALNSQWSVIIDCARTQNGFLGLLHRNTLLIIAIVARVSRLEPHRNLERVANYGGVMPVGNEYQYRV